MTWCGAGDGVPNQTDDDGGTFGNFVLGRFGKRQENNKPSLSLVEAEQQKNIKELQKVAILCATALGAKSELLAVVC